MELPKRKMIRIPNYDYSQCGVFFLTVCISERAPILWDKQVFDGSELPLSEAGRTVKECIEEIPFRYEAVSVEKYCIMPDHIHLLISIDTDAGGRPMVAPTVSRVMQQFKGAVSKKIGHPIWQKSFYDHIIRNDVDFLSCWQYIENNPLKYEVRICL